MILIRKPNTQDVYKAVLLITKEESKQAEYLQNWLVQIKNNDNFYSLVGVRDKKVVATLTAFLGVNNDEQIVASIGQLKGSAFLQKRLVDKLKKDFDPQEIYFTVDYKDAQEYQITLNMVPKEINLAYIKGETEQDELIEELKQDEHKDKKTKKKRQTKKTSKVPKKDAGSRSKG